MSRSAIQFDPTVKLKVTVPLQVGLAEKLETPLIAPVGYETGSGSLRNILYCP